MKNLSLTHLVWILFLSTSIIPIGILSYYNYSFFSELYERQSLEQLGQIADKKVNDIERFIEHKVNDLLVASKSPFVALALLEIEKQFYNKGIYSSEYSRADQTYREPLDVFTENGFYDLFLISTKGDIVFTLTRESDFATNIYKGPAKDSALSLTIKESLSTLTPSLNAFNYYQPSHKPAAFIATPIIQNGVVIGAVALQLNLNMTHKVISDDIGLGITGETVVATMDGHDLLFTAPLKSDPQAAFNRRITQGNIPDSILRGLNGEYGGGINVDYRNVPVLAVWRYLPSLEWGMVIKIDLAEVLEPIHQVVERLVLFLIIFLLVLFLISRYLGESILRPIINLQDSMKLVIESKILKKVKQEGSREVRMMADYFNEMTNNLLNHQKELESKVIERTAKYEEANALLRDEIEERLLAQRKLQMSSKIIEETNQAIVVTDKNANITDMNQAYYEMFGYSKQELMGKNPSFLSSGKQDTKFYKNLWHELINEGKWSGEIWDRKKTGELLPTILKITAMKDEQGDVLNYVGIQSDINVMKQYEKKLKHLAYFDALTGLPNRMLLNDRLLQDIALAKRTHKKLAVIFLDLDKFKQVNDTLGHSAGDDLLVIIADRLKNCVRNNDTVSRQGGDEFVLLLNNIHSLESISTIANNIIESVAKPVNLLGADAFVGASIGISIYPDDAKDADMLLKFADESMYQAKNDGRGRFNFYNQNQ